MNESYEPSLKKKKNDDSAKEKSNFMDQYKELIKKRKQKDDYYKDNDGNTDNNKDKTLFEKYNNIEDEIIDNERDYAKVDEFLNTNNTLNKETLIQTKNSKVSELIVDIIDKVSHSEERLNTTDILSSNNKDIQKHGSENKIDLLYRPNSKNNVNLQYEYKYNINHNQNYNYINKKEAIISNLNFESENKKMDIQEIKYLRYKYLKRNNTVLKLLNKDIFFRILSNESLFSEFEDTLNNCETSENDHHKSIDNLKLDKEELVKCIEENSTSNKSTSNSNLRIDDPMDEYFNQESTPYDSKASNLLSANFILDDNISINKIENDGLSMDNLKHIIDTSRDIIPSIKCQKCTFNTTDTKILSRHKIDHNEFDNDDNEDGEDYLFKCDRGCNFTSDRYDKYNKHLVYHIHKDCDPKYLECIYAQCSLCPFASSIIKIVKSHMNNFHPLSKNDFTIKKEMLKIEDNNYNYSPKNNPDIINNKENELDIQHCDDAQKVSETFNITTSKYPKNKEEIFIEEPSQDPNKLSLNENLLNCKKSKEISKKNTRSSYRRIINNQDYDDNDKQIGDNCNIKKNDLNFYICSYCEDVKETFDDMKKHIYIMHCRPPKERTLCWVCMKYLESDKHLIEHLFIHDDPFQEILIYDNIKGKNKNDICLSLFNREGVAIKTARHLSKYLNFPLFIDSSTQSLNGGNLYGCNYCNYTCSVTSNIRAHVDKYHQGCEISIRKNNEKRKYCVNRCDLYLSKNNTCIFCKFGTFSNKGERYYHMKNKHGIDICKLCNDCLTVMKNSYLKCDLCDNFDGTISDLRKHRKSHFIRQHYRKLNIVKCIINYMKNFTEISDDIFVCRHCKFISDKRDHSFLRKHLRDTHKFNKVCKKCSACKRHINKQIKSSLSKNLNVTSTQDIQKPNSIQSIDHNLPSKNQRIFRCNQCDFRHSDMKIFLKHAEKHKKKLSDTNKTRQNDTIDIKLYKCSFDNCNYQAHKKFCMEIHIMDHLNYKPYICPVCRSCYAAIYKLKEHMKDHLNTTKSIISNHNKKTEEVIPNFYTKNESIKKERKNYYSEVTFKSNKITLNDQTYQRNIKESGIASTNSQINSRIKKEIVDECNDQSLSNRSYEANMITSDTFNGIRIKEEKIDLSYGDYNNHCIENETKPSINVFNHDHSYFDIGLNIEESINENISFNNIKRGTLKNSSCNINDIINVVQKDKDDKLLIDYQNQKVVIKVEDIMLLNSVKLQELLNNNNVTSANLFK